MKAFLRKWYRFVRFYFKNNQISDAGKNNVVKIHHSIVTNVSITILGNNNTIDVHPTSSLSNLKIVVKGNHTLLKIGEGVTWKKGEAWLSNECNKLIIGNRTSIEEAHIAVGDNNTTVTLGEDCMLAYDVEIRSSDAHSIIDLESNRRINTGKSIAIGNHVWLGAHCIILKGSKIGDHSIIASSAVVTGIAEPNSIYGGLPAKLLRKNITWSREKIQTEKPDSGL